VHDTSNEHNIYLGSREVPSHDVFINRNLLYNGSYNGVQINGRFTNLHIEQNVLYSNGLSGISLTQRVSSSFIANNLAFNNSRNGLVLFNYDGNCLDSPPGPICPYDQRDNVIENNTFWAGTTDAGGSR